MEGILVLLFNQILVNTIFAIITALLTYIFLKNNFHVEIKRSYLIIFSVLYGILNGVLSTLWMSVLNIPDNLQFIKQILLFILNIVIIKYFFKIEWIKSILSFCVIIIFMGIGNMVALLPFYLFGINITNDVINVNLFYFIIANLIIYAITYILVKLSVYAKSIRNIKNLTPIGFLLIFTSIMLMSYITIGYIIKFDLITVLVLLISSLIYFLSSIWFIRIYHKYETQKEEQHQQAFYNESLANTLQDLKRIKHDQVNHLSVLYAMHQMKKYDEAESYLKEMLNINENIGSMSIYDIKNVGLFGIISTKMNYAKNNGITFNLKVFDVIDSIQSIKISDLCEVLGIYLDNALEEVLGSGKLSINMQIEKTDKRITIKIENECAEVPYLKKSKKGTDRGYGLIIANKILSSYKNIIHTTYFDKDSMMFSQILNIPQEA